MAKRGKNRVIFAQKMGIFCIKKRFLRSIFTFFQKIELLRRKTTQKKTFLGGIKKSTKIGKNSTLQALVGLKRAKIGLFFD